MKKLQYILALIISILIISTANGAWNQTKRHTYSARGADGDNSDGDIGVISGESVAAVGGLWDNCIVMSGNTYYFYEGYDSGNTALHNPPLVIVPWDMNANGRSSTNGISGTSAWRLMSTRLNNLQVDGDSDFVSGTTDWSGIIHTAAGGGGSGLTAYSINTMGRTGVSTMGFRGTSGVSYSVGGTTVYGGFETSGITIGGVTVQGLANLESGLTVVTGVTADWIHTVTAIDNVSGITVETSAVNGDVWIALKNDQETWRIEAKGSTGGDLYFWDDDEAVLKLINDGTATLASNFTANGNITSGGSIYAYDILGAGGVTEVSGLYLYTDNYLTSNYTVIKPHGLQSENFELTLPINSGVSDQVLKTNGQGGLAWSADDDTGAGGGISLATLTAYTTITAFTGSTGGVSDFVTGATDWSGVVGDSGTTDAKGMGVVFAGNGTVSSGDSVFISSPIGGTIDWIEIISDNPEDMTISFDLLRGTLSGTTNVTIADKIINTVTYSSGQSTYVSLGGTTSIAVREYLALQLTEAGGGVSEVSVMIAVKTQGGAEGISQATLTAYTNATAFSASTGGVTEFVTGNTDWSGVGAGGGISQATLNTYTDIGAFTGSTGGVSNFISGTTDWSGIIHTGTGTTNISPMLMPGEAWDISGTPGYVSGASNFEGVPTVHDDAVDAIVGIVIGDGAGNYVSGTTNDLVSGTTDWSGIIHPSSTTDWSGVKTTESDMVWDSGTTMASAVTKVATFTVINPQDIGGGSANSPFTIFPVPTFIYPNGVYVVGVGIGGQHAGAGFNVDFNWSEWSSGSCAFEIAELNATTNSGLAEDDIIGGATAVINPGNRIRGHLENTSGVSELFGFVAFKPL